MACETFLIGEQVINLSEYKWIGNNRKLQNKRSKRGSDGNIGDIQILDDFNARCGDNSEMIEGIDNVSLRTVIHRKENSHGDLLMNFLTVSNLAVLNERVGSQDFMCISNNGESVVDYVCIPHENLNTIESFSVLTMPQVINDVLIQPNAISDDSILLWEVETTVQIEVPKP
ncbi:hypothetical protein LOTGIDRAFT_157124 [Lottia gigantea]|uniref:Endonuclease/exonuclease/phosphatase domain-containing protein n=1 Tax=Lottia gigantea TaxID=225164 RepID=V4AWV2_LOTGI|nr:hypothetical protein LOTGIDRAFT_157124 [Lottia gigantea]ESP01988.1 hypothetical protein LOTGIDRAFT_157124 [Lottia gigantea]